MDRKSPPSVSIAITIRSKTDENGKAPRFMDIESSGVKFHTDLDHKPRLSVLTTSQHPSLGWFPEIAPGVAHLDQYSS